MAHASFVRRHIGFQLVFPTPKQLEASPVPDHRVEGREQAYSVVDPVPGGNGILGRRPEPYKALHLGMGIAGFGALLQMSRLSGEVRYSIAQQSTQIAQACGWQRRVELHYRVQQFSGAREPGLRTVVLRGMLDRLVDSRASLAPRHAQ